MTSMFNIRIYGILIEKNKLLVTDEIQMGIKMTKFPGGGLEFGEGPIECLKREWLEETGLDIEILYHYYTTEFFQPSYYLPEAKQIISIYYRVQSDEAQTLTVTENRYDFAELTNGFQTFRWLDLASVSPDEFTLPIDKVVAEMLQQDFRKGII
jgi:8-oxo-dGTP diphosphatase